MEDDKIVAPESFSLQDDWALLILMLLMLFPTEGWEGFNMDEDKMKSLQEAYEKIQEEYNKT